MKEYEPSQIIRTYYTILILDSCGDEYDELHKYQVGNDPKAYRNREDWDNIIEPAKYIIEMKKSDKELGKDYGEWDYIIVKHEEDEDSDWQSDYKVYKYRGQWRYKRVA